MILLSTSVSAATITVRTDREPVALGETFRIMFTVNGKQDGEPDFSPLNTDFQLLGTSQSSTFSMVNGTTSRSKTYSLTVTANRKGKITIPSIHFGKDASQTHPITVTEAKPAQPGPSPGQPRGASEASAAQLFMTAEVDTSNAYVQQQVILKLKVYRRIEWADANLSDPEFDGGEALIQQLGQEKSYQTTVNGKRYAVTELRYAVFPQQSGQLTIQPFRLTAKVATGKQQRRSPFGGFNDPFFDDFFTRPSYAVTSTSSKPIKLDIKATPAGFKGRHWLPAKSIQLQETWSGDIAKLEAGEPVTRTIALIADGLGTGQLPEIKLASQPGLKNYPDQPVTQEQATDSGLLSTVTQKVAIIPSHGGQFNIASIEVPWWNTTTDKMEIARIPSNKLTVSGAAPISAPAPPMATDDSPAVLPGEPAAQSVSTEPQGPIPYRWLIITSAVFLLLWLITLFAWLRARNKTAETPRQDVKDSTGMKRRQALKQIQAACARHDAAATRDALVAWSRTVWADAPPANLDEIAQQVDPDLAREISRLARSLYSQEESDWNAQSILEHIKKFRPGDANASQADSEGLEPLYR